MCALLAVLVALAVAVASRTRSRAFAQPCFADSRAIDLWKSRYCGCCRGWVDYMRARDCRVNVTFAEDVDAIKHRLGVPDAFASHDTARVGDYLLEGRVPKPAIAKLLAERRP